MTKLQVFLITVMCFVIFKSFTYKSQPTVAVVSDDYEYGYTVNHDDSYDPDDLQSLSYRNKITYGRNVREARDSFPGVPEDCDRTPKGGWFCANFMNPREADYMRLRGRLPSY